MPDIFTVLTCAYALICPSTLAALSIPLANDLLRKEKVIEVSNNIHNVDRQYLVGTTLYPQNPGPTEKNSSLYSSILASQVGALSAFENQNQSIIENTLRSLGPYKSLESFKAAYDALQSAELINIPQAFDNSDKNFGAIRLGIRGYNLKLVNLNEWSEPLNCLSDSLVREVCCESTINTAILNHKVFVQDFSTMGQYTDLNTTKSKYAPNVVGFFCNNIETGVLLPLAIKIVDSGLTYTKEDSAGEWQLAKMALDATELNYLQIIHFVEVHVVSIPIQIELMRSMAETHPIYALLNYHFFGNIGLEFLSVLVLFSVDSPFDRSVAFGASGSVRAAYDELQKLSITDDFPSDIAKNGLEYLPNHRYVKHGATYYSIIKTFVTKYIKAYYDSEDAIQSDMELQTWAVRASIVWGVNDFPLAFKGYEDLIKLVTNLVFRNAVKHHFMNGRVTWHSQAAPFSTPALYNTPLPTRKGVKVDPFDYVITSDLFPALSAVAAQFYRPIPLAQSVLSAYTTPPFSSETILKGAIAQFHQSMVTLENTLNSAKPKGNYLDMYVKPSFMPWFSYI
ncbi:unnamed protein product [Peronospora belbahrii]|uniref:Lipoxygenase domain-containing protein n=1 Tax=Peronospora belbahrii TaxID=622444 RepID=A0AAU9L5H4_9STRA|nr:unnamed protein product [Peronospora belbahrii]